MINQNYAYLRNLFSWRRYLHIRLENDPPFQREGPFYMTGLKLKGGDPGDGFRDWKRARDEALAGQEERLRVREERGRQLARARRIPGAQRAASKMLTAGMRARDAVRRS